MELYFEFVSLVRKDSINALSKHVLADHHLSYVIETTVHVGPFLLLIVWLSRRIARITSRIENFSKQVLAVENHKADTGDQLAILEHKFLSLTNDVKTRTELLEAANIELEAFTYSVSHDLRAPLRSIDGFSQALEEDFGDQLNEEGRDYLKRLRKGAQRMGSLIDDLLMLSHVGRSELNFETIDLSTLAQMLIEELRETDAGRDVEIKISPHLSVVGDAKLTVLVLQNLFANAWKFTSKRTGAIIEFGQCKPEETNLQTPHSQPVFFVRDNGAGFDMKFADQMFNAFHRLHRADEFPGTGVGLATVQRIINRHDGQIWAESKVDNGATFYFTFGELS